jgi:hypothetical protein
VLFEFPFKAQVFKSAGNIFCWRVWGRVTDYCLDRLLGFSEFGEKLKWWRFFSPGMISWLNHPSFIVL